MTEDQRHNPPTALWGILITAIAVIIYLIGVVSAPILRLLDKDQGFSRFMVWSSGAPLLLETQLTTLVFNGNFAVAKLLESKHLGKACLKLPVKPLAGQMLVVARTPQ